MSIENNLKHIADALEKIAGSTEAPAPAAPAPAPAPAPAAPAPAAPAPAAPAAHPAHPAAAMTVEQLNEALVVEFRRLGSREPIDNAMAQFGVTSVNALQPVQYQPLLDVVKAIVK